MPSPLTQAQQKRFRHTLDQRLKALREEVRQQLLATDNERYLDIAGQVHDAGDAAVADLLADIELAEIERDAEEIRDIEAAMSRLSDGRYGQCSGCGDSIAIERLDAYPTAKRCLSCQERFEQTHRPMPETTR